MFANAAFLLVAFTSVNYLSYSRPQQAAPNVIRHGDCVADAELLALPACAFETKNGGLYVARYYLPMFFGSRADAYGSPLSGTNHFAFTAMVGGWAYFDRTGRIIVQNVATMDNGPNAFHHGLVRVERNRKWGLADTHGRIETPLTYDGMLDFQEGKGWLACSGCHEETGGEYHWFKGGQWFWLDRKGKVLRAAQEPL